MFQLGVKENLPVGANLVFALSAYRFVKRVNTRFAPTPIPFTPNLNAYGKAELRLAHYALANLFAHMRQIIHAISEINPTGAGKILC